MAAGTESASPPAHVERHAAITELVFTVILALAAVGTAWAGFQSAKWSGVQANAYAAASAARVESTRMSTEAGQAVTIDMIIFTQWLSALNAEIAEDPTVRPGQVYEPDPETLSGFLHDRFRDEFRPAFDAWIATRPLVTPDAPKTPFELPEYQLASEVAAEQQRQRAEQETAQAHAANQRSDNYVLLGVMFALVLFFVAVGSKARARRSRILLLVLSLLTLVTAAVILSTYPVEI